MSSSSCAWGFARGDADAAAAADDEPPGDLPGDLPPGDLPPVDLRAFLAADPAPLGGMVCVGRGGLARFVRDSVRRRRGEPRRGRVVA